MKSSYSFGEKAVREIKIDMIFENEEEYAQFVAIFRASDSSLNNILNESGKTTLLTNQNNKWVNELNRVFDDIDSNLFSYP